MKKMIIISILPILLFFVVLIGVVGSVSNDSSSSSNINASEVQGLPSTIKEEMVIASLEVQAKYGYPTSVCLAQIIQESSGKNEGLSKLAYEHCNLFGLKASRGWDGKIIEMQTKEQDKNGNEYTIYAKFRKYDTWTDSINDRAELLKKSSTYDVDGITNADEFAKRLEKWATDIDYSETLIKHMKKYDLYKFDTMTVEEFKEDSNNIMVSGDSELGNAIANSALSKRGCQYVWGASGPDTFDCSGLVWWACNENGVKFERTTASQLSKMGKSVKYEELQAGDIITFKTDPSYVSHVGIYIGNGQMVHAPNRTTVVKVQQITSGYYYERIYNCRRLY
ncbi:NlpC/P60 family protein [Thomasclavelia cocleata]|uniref:NlpC/P60 family protein n=1 Tax=Thomasclavelia cocleata TaxID=69824 RepID=UPI0026108EC8|nr:NlpC/P60 family protein [Thomasclavelia cocleata]